MCSLWQGFSNGTINILRVILTLTMTFDLLFKNFNIAPANLHNALRGPSWLCQYSSFVYEHHIYRTVTVWWQFCSFTRFWCFLHAIRNFVNQKEFSSKHMSTFLPRKYDVISQLRHSYAALFAWLSSYICHRSYFQTWRYTCNKRPKGPHIVHLSTICHLFEESAKANIFVDWSARKTQTW